MQLSALAALLTVVGAAGPELQAVPGRAALLELALRAARLLMEEVGGVRGCAG
jgi:hypothetical protein